jgi:hypothetical protein
MAPVASGIPDTKENRPVEFTGCLESVLAPGVPINRIELMLQEIRGLLSGQSIWRGVRDVRGERIHSPS